MYHCYIIFVLNYPHNQINNLNEKIHKADGAIQHTDQINESHSTINSTPQTVADHNLFIKTVSSTQQLHTALTNMTSKKITAHYGYLIIIFSSRFGSSFNFDIKQSPKLI